MSQFFMAMIPHLAANLLTVLFVYGVIQAQKSESRGDKFLFGPGSSLAVLLFCLYGLYLYDAFDAFR